jgi:hypothetical protein
VVAMHLTDGGVHIHHQRPFAGAGTAAHARPRIAAVSWSSWRTCPEVKLRSHVPTVEAAITRWPSTAWLDPQRNSSMSSMQSPPAIMA